MIEIIGFAMAVAMLLFVGYVSYDLSKTDTAK